jgi:hypothetical protein
MTMDSEHPNNEPLIMSLAVFDTQGHDAGDEQTCKAKCFGSAQRDDHGVFSVASASFSFS